MVKIKLLGIYKSKKHNTYIFKKSQAIFAIVRGLLKELGFKKFEVEAFGRPLDKKWGEPIYNKEGKIKDYTDKRYMFEEKEYHIEIVFGKDRVFLMIHTEKDRQRKLSKFLSKFVKK